MNGIVLELQRKALDPEVRVSDLLRMALVAARKLRLAEFATWVESELNGYSSEKPPEYREIRGQVKGHNPYTGAWMPLFFQDPQLAEMVSKQRSTQPVAELEHLAASNGSMFHLPFPDEIRSQLSTGFGFETQVSLITDRASLIGILDAVRTVVLNWSLQLEEAGVYGEGLSFSQKEVAMAQQTPQNVNNFYGTVQGQQIQQGNVSATQSQVLVQLDVESLRQLLPQLEAAAKSLSLSNDSRREMEAELATVQSQVASPKPKHGIIKESLKSIKTILEGVAGGAGGQLAFELGKYLLS